MQIRQFPRGLSNRCWKQAPTSNARGFWPSVLCRGRTCIARHSFPVQASGSDGRMERLQSFNVNAPPPRKSDWPVDEIRLRSVPRLQGQDPDDEDRQTYPIFCIGSRSWNGCVREGPSHEGCGSSRCPASHTNTTRSNSRQVQGLLRLLAGLVRSQ
jgi:hypothetical protein